MGFNDFSVETCINAQHQPKKEAADSSFLWIICRTARGGHCCANQSMKKASFLIDFKQENHIRGQTQHREVIIIY